MNNKEKVGGRAYKNGVKLMNSNYSVKAYYDNRGNLNIKLNKVKRSRLTKYIKKIPILRGIVSLFLAVIMFLKESVSNPRRYWFVLLIILLDMILLLLPSSTSENTFNFILLLYYSLPVIMLIFFKDIVVEVLKYHGAEHKAVNYYENNCQGDLKSYSRLHKRCGSNIVFYYIIISLIIGFFNIGLNPWLLEIIALGLAYEAIKYTPDKLLFIPYIFQRLVTKEPEERHLKAANVALNYLIKN